MGKTDKCLKLNFLILICDTDDNSRKARVKDKSQRGLLHNVYFTEHLNYSFTYLVKRRHGDRKHNTEVMCY